MPLTKREPQPSSLELSHCTNRFVTTNTNMKVNRLASGFVFSPPVLRGRWKNKSEKATRVDFDVLHRERELDDENGCY